MQSLIARIQEKESLSLRGMAAAMGCDHGYFSRVIAGKQPLTVKMANDISNTFGLSTADRLQLFQSVTSFHGMPPSVDKSLAALLARDPV